MSQPLRRLSPSGIEAFRRFLAELADGGTPRPPRWLLGAAGQSEPLEREIPVEERSFSSRLEAARSLAHTLGGLQEIEEDVGLWSWLSLFYFDQVCPPRPDGTRAPGRTYRHILEPGYRTGHRHLLAGAWLVYRLHGEGALLLLCSPLHVESQFHHELASRQALITNRAIVEAAAALYLDEDTGRPKRGAQDRDGSPGTLHRFIEVIQQLDVNYDLYSMSAAAILGLLPAEFRRWRQRARLPFRRARSATGG